MGLKAFGDSVRLNDLKGDLLAVKYLGSDVSIDGDYGLTTAARAEVVTFSKNDDVLVARRRGTTLVFQQAIANEIRGSSDWAVGIFEEVARPLADAPDATMYTLTTPEESLEDIGAAMEAAGIDIS